MAWATSHISIINSMSLSSRVLLSTIRAYRLFISPALPARCRFYPTCSQYGLQAIRWHGAYQGGWLTLKRLCRCHPLGGQGVDFVPLPLSRWRYHYLADSNCLSFLSPVSHETVNINYHMTMTPPSMDKKVSDDVHVAHKVYGGCESIESHANVSCETQGHHEISLVERGIYIDRHSYRAMLNHMFSNA